eukprot:251383_1
MAMGNNAFNCANNCTINCTRNAPCHGVTINGGNGNVVVNCIGKSACGGIHIKAKTANLLQVKLQGSFSASKSTIECPENKYCNITMKGADYGLDGASIIGSIGSKLFIKVEGGIYLYYYQLGNADIYCPPDNIAGTKYTNGAICDISGTSWGSLNNINIFANEGFNNV